MADADLFGFDERDTGRLRAVVRAFEAGQLGRPVLPQFEPRSRDYTAVPFRHTASSETIPAYGLMRVTGMATVDDIPLWTVEKPNTTFGRLYLVNGCEDVVSTSGTAYGWGTWLWHADYVLYDTANTPDFGESWGPQDGTWTLKKWRYGFTIQGSNAGTGATSRTIAIQDYVNHFYGQTDAAINKGSSGTVSVFDGNNADTSINVSSVQNKFANVAITKKVSCTWEGGVWRLTSAEC